MGKFGVSYFEMAIEKNEKVDNRREADARKLRGGGGREREIKRKREREGEREREREREREGEREREREREEREKRVVLLHGQLAVAWSWTHVSFSEVGYAKVVEGLVEASRAS